MKKTKKIVATLMAATMVLASLSACSAKTEPVKEETKVVEDTKEEKAEEVAEVKEVVLDANTVIPVIAKGFQHQFWQAVKQGSEEAAAKYGIKVDFQGPESESAIPEQVRFLDAAINQAPVAICLASLDTEASLESIKNAKEAGIPIIGFDSGVPGAPEGAIKANAATDNVAAGAKAAEELHKLISEKLADPAESVRIGVVSQEANSQSIVDRTSGFINKMIELVGEDKVSVIGHDKFNKKNDAAKVILEVGIPANVKDDEAAAVASAIMNKEDLVAIYGSNEFAANAIINANETLEILGADKVIGVGFDAGKKQKQAVKDGILVGSITQDPVQIGFKAVELAVMAAKGEEVSDIDTGSRWYTAENMEDAEIAPLLYD